MGFIDREAKRDLKAAKKAYKNLEKARALILSTDYPSKDIDEMIDPIWKYMTELREEIRVSELWASKK